VEDLISRQFKEKNHMTANQTWRDGPSFNKEQVRFVSNKFDTILYGKIVDEDPLNEIVVFLPVGEEIPVRIDTNEWQEQYLDQLPTTPGSVINVNTMGLMMLNEELVWVNRADKANEFLVHKRGWTLVHDEATNSPVPTLPATAGSVIRMAMQNDEHHLMHLNDDGVWIGDSFFAQAKEVGQWTLVYDAGNKD
jgi:hypothetical protein